MNEKAKEREEFFKREDRIEKQNAKINENLHKKDYLVTVFEEGDELMGSSENQICPRRYYKLCSLEEIAELISFMKEPFWRHPDLRKDASKKDIKKIKFEEKEWGINSRIVIEPLTKELEEQYLERVKSNFFEHWREYFARKEIS